MSPLFGRSKDADEPEAPAHTFPDAPTYGTRTDPEPAEAPVAGDPSAGDEAASDEDLDAASAAGAAAVGEAGGAAPADGGPGGVTTAGTLPPNMPVTGTVVQGERAGTMIPARTRRSAVESFFMRIIATFGIVAIGVAIGAIMTSQHVHGWIIGLVVALVTVVLSAVLWSSQRL